MLTIAFDLDGTLADTSGDLIAAANACFRDMGAGDLLRADRDAGTALRGGMAMLRLGFSRMGQAEDEAQIATWYPRLLQAYGAAICDHTVLYPGAMAAVDVLRARGHPVVICTNKPEHLARQLLQDLRVLDQFDALIGADTLPVRKPDPEPLFEAVRRGGGHPDHCVLVGDTLTDYTTSQRAGAGSILVSFGPDPDSVADLQPDAWLHHFDALADLISDWPAPQRGHSHG